MYIIFFCAQNKNIKVGMGGEELQKEQLRQKP